MTVESHVLLGAFEEDPWTFDRCVGPGEVNDVHC